MEQPLGHKFKVRVCSACACFTIGSRGCHSPERPVCQEQPVRDAHQWVFEQELLVQVQHRVRQMAFLLFVFQSDDSVFLAGAHLTVVIPEKKVADGLLCLVGVPVSPAFTVHSCCFKGAPTDAGA